MESSKFGKYQVVEKIGEGGFGEVFKGRDPTLKRFVAIKTCKAASREFLDRFLLEAEISARLQHPNIVTIYDFGYQGETPYLVQEYLAGEDLDRKIRRRAAMDVATRVDVLRQAAIGLRHAHHRGVVHRDVKPANLRVLEDGRVKIMDFGIAKLLSSEVELTQTGMTLGTARYQAPEQFRGDKIDLRADIFAFGVTAYEIFTYERPFDGDSVARIFYRITHEEPRPILELWPECPESLEQCIANCLRKEPAHRYSDLAPVINVLEAYGATAGSSSYSMAAMPTAASSGPPFPPPSPPAADSATAGTVASEARADSDDGGIVSRAYDTAVSLQRSPAARIGAFVVVALLAFALTYAAGKLWQGEKAPVDPADAGASMATVTPAVETPVAEPVSDSVITEPALPVRKPLAAGEDAAAAVADGAAAAPPPRRKESAPPPSPPPPSPPPPSPPPPTSPPPTPPPPTPPPPTPPPPTPPPPTPPPPTPPASPPPTTPPSSSPAPSSTPPPPTPPPALEPAAAAAVPPSTPTAVQGVASAAAERSVVLYVNADFQGPSEIFYGDDPDLVDNRIGSDTASSVRVAPGCQVRLYRKPAYKGRTTVLTADVASLRDTEVGNDEVSSIEVDCAPSQR